MKLIKEHIYFIIIGYGIVIYGIIFMIIETLLGLGV